MFAASIPAGFLDAARANRAGRFRTTAAMVVACTLLAATPGGCLPQKYSTTSNNWGGRFRPKPVPPGPNGIFMDVIHVERPFDDNELNGELWASADEEQLTISLREKLAAQGFRVAVLGGALPTILKTLFNEEEIGQMNGEHLQIQHAIPTFVQTGGPHASWP